MSKNTFVYNTYFVIFHQVSSSFKSGNGYRTPRAWPTELSSASKTAFVDLEKELAQCDWYRRLSPFCPDPALHIFPATVKSCCHGCAFPPSFMCLIFIYCWTCSHPEYASNIYCWMLHNNNQSSVKYQGT